MTAPKRPETWVCNACGAEGDPSREHLIHVSIGRVILGNRQLTGDEVRNRLQSGRFQEFGLYPSPTSEDQIGKAWPNTAIRGLLCRDCNGGWAKDLEESAGENLYDFLHLYGPADAPLLRRWAWFFAIKLWFAHTRPEHLAAGPMRPILGKVARRDVEVAMPVRLVRLPVSPRTFDFAANIRGWAGNPDSPYIMWVMSGVAMLAVAPVGDRASLPIPRSTELEDGLRIPRVAQLRKREMWPLFAAPPVTPGRSSP